MATEVSENDFVSGKQSCSYGKSTRIGVKRMTDDETVFMKGARRTLWKHLRGMSVHGGKGLLLLIIIIIIIKSLFLFLLRDSMKDTSFT